MNDPDILVIGCGNMGAALVRGYLSRVPSGGILVIDPDVERAELLLANNGRLTTHLSVSAAGDSRPGLTVLAVKPQIMSSVLQDLADYPAAEGLVVSIAAGVSMSFLERYLPNSALVRAMPNTPAMIGAGFTALWGNSRVGDEDRRRCNALFESVGVARWLASENELDAVTAVSGSGPAYFFACIEAVVKAAISLGLSAQAAGEMARATMAGAAAMLRDPTAGPEALKAAVRSPNGTTDAALQVFEEDGALDNLFRSAISAAHQRAISIRNSVA